MIRVSEHPKSEMKAPEPPWRRVYCWKSAVESVLKDEFKMESDDTISTRHVPRNVPIGTVGILFSGGMDSTYLAAREMEQGKNVLPIINEINSDFPVYRLMTMVALQSLKRKYGHLLQDPYCAINGWRAGMADKHGLIQQPINIFSLGFMARDILEKLESIQAGFVDGDDALYYVPELRGMYKSVMKISHAIYHPNEKIFRVPPLKFPLAHTDKKEIYENLKAFGVESLTVSCEDQSDCAVYVNDEITDKPGKGLIRFAECGYCHSCHRKGEYGHPLKYIDIEFDIRPEHNFYKEIREDA